MVSNVKPAPPYSEGRPVERAATDAANANGASSGYSFGQPAAPPPPPLPTYSQAAAPADFSSSFGAPAAGAAAPAAAVPGPPAFNGAMTEEDSVLIELLRQMQSVSKKQISRLVDSQARIQTALTQEQRQLERINFAISKVAQLERYEAAQRTLDNRGKNGF